MGCLYQNLTFKSCESMGVETEVTAKGGGWCQTIVFFSTHHRADINMNLQRLW